MANLFVVPKRPVQRSAQPDDVPNPLLISGNVYADTATALQALAFLRSFFIEFSAGDLSHLAEEFHAIQMRARAPRGRVTHRGAERSSAAPEARK